MSETDPMQVPSYLIKRTARWLMRRGEARLRPLGLGMAYLPVLTAIRNGTAATQAELARLLQVEQPSMAQLLSRLERDGLIVRAADPERPRVQRITLTALAQMRLPQAKAALGKDNEQALKGFSEKELALFVDLLQRFDANLRHAPEAAGGDARGARHTD